MAPHTVFYSFVRLAMAYRYFSIFITLIAFTSNCLANVHPVDHFSSSFSFTPSKIQSLTNTEDAHKESEFAVILQDRILQILAHQLIDEKLEEERNDFLAINTHYLTKTFSVNINSMNSEYFIVSIKDILQNKETLLEIPR